jgi:hypothetical protein
MGCGCVGGGSGRELVEDRIGDLDMGEHVDGVRVIFGGHFDNLGPLEVIGDG